MVKVDSGIKREGGKNPIFKLQANHTEKENEQTRLCQRIWVHRVSARRQDTCGFEEIYCPSDIAGGEARDGHHQKIWR